MESILETQRNLHEERERCIDAMTKEFLSEKRTQKEKINSDQRAKAHLDRYRVASQKLAQIYKDDDGERNKELHAIAGPNEFAEFYSRLKVLKDVHRKNPNETAMPLTIEFQEMNNFIQNPDRVEKEMVRFTDEEGYGRFLDMHLLHDQYLNLKGVRKTDYISYLGKFDQLYEFSKEVTKKTGTYKEYINALLAYLKDFLNRTKPLIDLDRELENCDKEFEVKWKEGQVPGWTKDKSSGSLSNQGAYLDLSSFNSPEELEALGTLKDRAERLFATKGKNPNELPDRILNLKLTSVDDKEEKRQYNLARTEYQIYRLSDFVSEERQATKENVERKQARAAGEEEVEEEVEEVQSEEEEDTSIPYNPKNLPLDWDGKPIPYWLYKLHGLNISFSCEICGNQVYKGPKAFQRHFTEWRHSHGMRCLGIPNTAHFVNITKINDALELWKKMCNDREVQKWNPDMDEEFEDSQGNVVNRRTFEDLKRQGLL
uniref:Matrin-type domain-containing protein n=1 Tax=Acrobeloides nanus TaxID=290746 RepID=A0A914DEL0_9BILA